MKYFATGLAASGALDFDWFVLSCWAAAGSHLKPMAFRHQRLER